MEVRIIIFILALGWVRAFIPQKQRGKRSTMLSMQDIVLFHPTNLRVHDHPCLQYVEEESDCERCQLVYIKELECGSESVIDPAAQCLKQNLHLSLAAPLNIVSTGSLVDSIDEVINKATSEYASRSKLNLITSECDVEPYRSRYNLLLAHVRESHPHVHVKVLKDDLSRLPMSLEGLNFVDNKRKYKSRSIAQPRMEYTAQLTKKLLYASEQSTDTQQHQPVDTTTTATTTTTTKSAAGETLALSLIQEYLHIGEDTFSRKYEDRYVRQMSFSTEHEKSLNRLRTLPGKQYNSYFQGEVLSGLLAPLITQGCVSPRLLMHSRRTLFKGWSSLALSRPITCRLRNEVVRKDWHRHVAKKSVEAHTSTIQSPWEVSFRSWRGYIQREAVMTPASVHEQDNEKAADVPILEEAATVLEKPILVLIHGFGGSINQNTALAQTILSQPDSGGFSEVHAIDSLGFGQSEKPPLSYNQYLWRDQVVEYVERIAKEKLQLSSSSSSLSSTTSTTSAPAAGAGGVVRVVLAGNSIGGFTAASAAAALAERYAAANTNNSTRSSSSSSNAEEAVNVSQYVRCDGLVLLNSAGVVINGTTDTATTTATSTAAAAAAVENKNNESKTSNRENEDKPESIASPVFTDYSGPASELLRYFGMGVFAALQPRITTTCKWLYPVNPEHVVSSALGDNIYRDSCDPGASDVIAAGGKLPKPFPMNELLKIYRGPVLVAQGALDPLNDAVARAYAFQKIRPNVSIDLLPLGHCPMDEGAHLVADSVIDWGRRTHILQSTI